MTRTSPTARAVHSDTLIVSVAMTILAMAAVIMAVYLWNEKAFTAAPRYSLMVTVDDQSYRIDFGLTASGCAESLRQYDRLSATCTRER